MKTKVLFILEFAVMIGLSSCTEDKFVSNTQLVKSINITGQDFQSGEHETKAAYTVDGTGFHFSWTEGDTVGIYPVGGDQVAFPISSGEGSQTAQFDGGAWALRSSYSYAAYYPYVKGNYMVDETQIPISFIGQTQNGNGSLDCLDRFDYQASLATNPDVDGNVSIELKHLACFVRFQFTMPIEDTYQSITLTSSKTPFITSGTFDLTKDEIAITPNTSSSSITANLNNTFTTGDNKVLTVFAMLAPTNFSDSEISISIEGTTYKSYSATVSGKNMIAGKAYSYSAKVQSGTNINGSDVEWDDEGNEILPQYEYVDLGLSVNWATFNVGASKPEEYGDYYAWGETETYYEEGYAQEHPQTYWISGKDYGYHFSNYKWCHGTYITLMKYNSKSYYGTIDNKSTLELEDDVAHEKWGDDWRIATSVEMDEILRNCTWTWTTINGVNGCYVTSKVPGFTNRSIFLPASGYRYCTNLNNKDTLGCYWTSSLTSSGPDKAYAFTFDSTSAWRNNNGRDHGRTIRPVCSSKEWSSHIKMSLDVDKLTLIHDGNYKLKTSIKYDGEDYFYSGITWSSDNPSVATVDNTGKIMALSKGIAHIIASIDTVCAQCLVTVLDESEIEHEYVDLGLSVKWATYNIGASMPEEYGDHFAWGETGTYYKPGFAQETTQVHWKDDKSGGYLLSNYKFCNGGNPTSYTKYCNNSKYGNNGFVDNKTTLLLEDDAAHVIWGGKWRMPTKNEWDDLLNSDNCTWTWTRMNDVYGYEVSSNKRGYEDCSIFLPAAGFINGADLRNKGGNGIYWSSTLDTESPFKSWTNNFNSDNIIMTSNDRVLGFSVRPVCP